MKKTLFLLVGLWSFTLLSVGGSPQLPQEAEEIVTYRLYPTENMWTFLKLDTRNGKIWQVQYDIEGENRFEVYLNIMRLVPKNEEMNGRFRLYPTKNFYNFILLDQVDGRLWQVQWSIEEENRMILPIK